MSINTNQILTQAISMHNEEKYEEAEKLYQEILKVEPKHVEANHDLGVLKISLSLPLDGMLLLKNAIEINPSIEQFWISYANTLLNQKNFNKAEKNYKKAIELIPNKNDF